MRSFLKRDAGADLAQKVVLVQVLTPRVGDLLVGARWRRSRVDFEKVAPLGAVALFHILIHSISPEAVQGRTIGENKQISSKLARDAKESGSMNYLLGPLQMKLSFGTSARRPGWCRAAGRST